MLVFHAGPHKTATTYLQVNLQHARAELAKRGWSYPRQGTDGAGHHNIARTAPDWLAEGSDGHRILARLPRDGNLVFSTEVAARWAPERYHVLADILGKEQIDVVYTLRDPIDLFQSHWAEQIKQGQTWGLAERMAEHFADPCSSSLLNPQPVLQALIDDPRIRLHVIPFQVLKDRQIDIYTHFCAEILGLDGMQARRSAPRNVGLPILQTEFLRLLMLLAADGARRIDSTLRHRFILETTEAERRALGSLVRVHGQAARRRVVFPAPHPFKIEQEERLRAALAGCWTLDPGDAPLYGRDPQEYVYYDAFVLMQCPEIVEAVEKIMAQLGADGVAARGLRIALATIKGNWKGVRR